MAIWWQNSVRLEGDSHTTYIITTETYLMTSTWTQSIMCGRPHHIRLAAVAAKLLLLLQLGTSLRALTTMSKRHFLILLLFISDIELAHTIKWYHIKVHAAPIMRICILSNISAQEIKAQRMKKYKNSKCTV